MAGKTGAGVRDQITDRSGGCAEILLGFFSFLFFFK